MPENTTGNYERARQQLIAKTKRRRIYFDGTRRDHVEARRRRRACGGAFGKLSGDDFKALALGTIRGDID